MAHSVKTDATAQLAVESERGNCRCLVGERRAAIHFVEILAQATRLKIVCCLMAGERSVGELAALASLQQSNVSQHLARLRQAGLVSARRDGVVTLYGIADQRVRLILQAVWQVKFADRWPRR